MEKESNKLETMRHSASHLLAAAVLKFYPKAKFGIGPAIENGFYYDFDLGATISEQDLSKIENEMLRLKTIDLKIEKETIPKTQALPLFTKLNQDYKLELINEIKAKSVTVYKLGDFVDLCRGPHVSSTRKIGPFKIINTAGAYWRGSEKNPMMTRIYGTAFADEKDLSEYLNNLRQLQKYDHRKIGAQLDLFSFHQQSPGAVFWHPKGKILYENLINFSREIQAKYGYHEVAAPDILNLDIWKQSSHYVHYKNAMYFIQAKNESISYALRPMDCPGEILIYKTQTRSFRELPIRFSEYGTIFRKELSGTLHGLFRVVQFVQDDAHIFVTEEQIKDEISQIIKLAKEVYQTFGLEFKVFLSTRPAEFVGKVEAWDKAEADLKKALINNKMDFEIAEGEGAFYGPKIDFQLQDVFGRSWQCGTIQLDFQMPEKFEMEYVGSSGKPQRPVILHRTILGSMERFIGVLLEHFKGNLPLWLCPVQVLILPIASRHQKAAEKVADELKQKNIRVEVDSRNLTVSKKVREGELDKIPYLCIIGDKEISKDKIKVAVRTRGKDMGQLALANFQKQVISTITNKK
ncbi:MAG: threonine--tRNA ligase [Candidatus Nealsonbacteria bacterium CG23_combo_of_CG06-09_8_20_14_all_40_13]|uniref:Threonine--tRNA ligase n=1 Tax=Candidatus Nealsonbacteria bacterium CG23_combo_of_CG06-09_8_20_14_all_40_13 TaxID=1974724 RepID=A0A2G9YRD1_9BACT|nr:MAG: threonine--tRNA ligase [Candidatus Nealsonbacteria bacterium CG23_combo_of_CG06-09_8_20_14_all_40_13]PIR71300.1 MAG: threonine--tRNA ligase [Candidatus Nealsonbacteria bacterium CG10_big_fil_rev_8_21_14_0_10_40_24]